MNEPRSPIDAARQQNAERQQRPARHSVDTITDNDLDALYAEREKCGQGWLDAARKARVAEAALAFEKETSQRLLVQRQEMAAERYAWQERGEQAEQRAEQAEAAIARAREVEEQWRMHFLATGEAAGGHALAMVRAALDEPKEPTPSRAGPVYPNAKHRGGNAEDCQACCGTNPPYPFLCPGPEQPA